MNSNSRQFDLVVVGAGPAGLAAATCAGESGLSVAIVDDNVAPGGQIWRGKAADPAADSASWGQRLRSAGVEQIYGTAIVDQPSPGVLIGERPQGLLQLSYKQIVIATGARERFLPFPGWTLPNVMGAGGLQAMVEAGLPVEGKRVVVAGSGPLLLAVGAYLRRHGAEVLIVAEQASWMSLARFATGIAMQSDKVQQALALRRDLSGVPISANSWPIAAEGDGKLESVTISKNGRHERFACDYLACGFHLVPNLELAVLLGCEIDRGFVHVDELQRTSVSKIFCAGEPTGIGGLELSLVEGQIAGLAAAGNHDAAGKLFRLRKKLRKFARALDKAFTLRAELRDLSGAGTLVCRCEDVNFARLQSQPGWHAAKLQTRCGMGPCQGRVCGPAVQFLFDWVPDSVRPPIFPVRVATLAAGAGAAAPTQGARLENTGGHA